MSFSVTEWMDRNVIPSIPLFNVCSQIPKNILVCWNTWKRGEWSSQKCDQPGVVYILLYMVLSVCRGAINVCLWLFEQVDIDLVAFVCCVCTLVTVMHWYSLSFVVSMTCGIYFCWKYMVNCIWNGINCPSEFKFWFSGVCCWDLGAFHNHDHYFMDPRLLFCYHKSHNL